MNVTVVHRLTMHLQSYFSLISFFNDNLLVLFSFYAVKQFLFSDGGFQFHFSGVV